MKPTTYAIIALAAAGAMASGVMAYMIASDDREIPRYEFDSPDKTVTLPCATTVVVNIEKHYNVTDKIRMDKCADFKLFIIESDSVAAPGLSASEQWLDLLTFSATDSVLTIKADYHALAEFYSTVTASSDDQLEVVLHPSDLTLTVPRGMVHKFDFPADNANLVFDGFMTESLDIDILDRSSIKILNSDITRLNLSPKSDLDNYRWTNDIYFAEVTSSFVNLDITDSDVSLTGTADLGRITVAMHSSGSPEFSIGDGIGFTSVDWKGDVKGNISIDLTPGQSLTIK